MSPLESEKNHALERVLGVDVGSSQIKVVVLEGTQNSIVSTHSMDAATVAAQRPTKGNPLAVLARLLTEEVAPVVTGPVRIVVTGYGQDLISKRLGTGQANEVVAAAKGVDMLHPNAKTVLDLGGQFTKWIRLSDDRSAGLVAEFALNGLCAAGSGAFLEQQATRLKVSVEELGKLALSAKRGATIAGRCSVFAKSDMIHLQQKGTPPEEIAYGLCLALARTFVATVMSGRTADPPVVLVGGGADNPGLVRAFEKVLKLPLGDQLVVPDRPSLVAALGACLLADEQTAVMTIQEAVDKLEGSAPASEADAPSTPVLKIDETGIDLEPLRRPVESYSQMGTEDPGDQALAGSGPIQAYLGLDVGSVSTNLVVMSPEGEVLQGIYLATKGRPVEVISDGLRQIEERFGDRLHILAAGATGSGRYLAERLVGMDVVHNEITAQMVSAARFVPDVDTIFEIGGQDSKYIGAEQGHLTSFEMNKICAAGTGSFLEEQAERLGVKIIGEFAQHAFESRHPYDLGSRCTVFMDTELVRALQQGVCVDDLCAGLAYSIAKNYLDRVVAGRPIGKHIVFSGGTASNESVVAAFQQILGRPIQVHPYNRIAGALGAALLAQRRHRYQPATQSRFMGLGAIRDYEIRTFECRRCPNLCQVNRVKVGNRVAHFGDACERYSGKDRDTTETTRPSLKLFERRGELFSEHMPPSRPEARPKLGIPMASLMLEYAPLWATFLDELGFQPVLSGPTTSAIMENAGVGLPGEVCLPIKLAAGHVAALLGRGVHRIFMPSMQELPGRGEPGDVAAGCVFAQLLPEMLKMQLGDNFIAPQVCLADEGGFLEASRELADALDRPLHDVQRALKRALDVQLSFHRTRLASGREAMHQDFDRAVVIIGRPYNVHDAYMNLDLARHIERLGIATIPFDTLPLEDIQLDSRWDVLPWRFNRDQVRALQFISNNPRLFPLIVSNYGCGPDAFTLKHLEGMMSHRPHLVLEFDEHRGEAGMVTRLEAFADEIEEYFQSKNKRLSPRPPAHRNIQAIQKSMKRCFIPYYSDHSYVISGLLAGVGIETKILPPADETTVRMAEELGTGRECHPYSLIAGELGRLLQSEPILDGDAFFVQGTVTPCLLTQYGDGYRYVLRRLGEPRLKIFDPRAEEMLPLVGVAGLTALYEGLLAVDMMMIAAYRFRPYEKHPGSVMKAHRITMEEVEDTVRLRGDMAKVIENGVRRLRAVPLRDESRRPIVGVVGDLYTRMNTVGNAGLFDRLEEMGCEVWLNPFFANYEDYSAQRDAVRWMGRSEIGKALWRLFAAGAVENRSLRMRQALDEELRAHCIEPTPERINELASPYLGRWTNHLVLTNVGKMVDFIDRGADGVINAIGLNCMVGIASDAALQAIKRDHPNVPMTTLVYGGSEGPSQRIRLETFVQQVQDRYKARQARAEGNSTERPTTARTTRKVADQ